MKNDNLKFKISILFIFSSLIFPFELNRTEAASANLNKTAEYFVGQESAVKASGELVSLPSFTVNIPEASPVVKSAIIEISGVSYSNSGVNQMIMADLQRNTDPAGTEPSYIFNYTLGGTNGKPRPFTIKYNALENNLGQAGLGAMSDLIASSTDYVYKLYLKDTVASGAMGFSLASAKLTLTYYNSAPAGSVFLKTNKFFIVQEIGSAEDGTPVGKDFTLTISEQSPAIQSVFIEVSGVAKASGAGAVGVSVTDQGAPANYANYNLDLNGAGNISKFVVRHDASAVILSADFPGSKTYTLRLKGAGFSTNLWNAKLIVTYKYTQNLGGLPAKGELVSSTFDTGAIKGAAYNSLLWKGNFNGGVKGMVRFQLAASNCPGGQSDYPACASGAWGDINTPFVGYSAVSDCGSSVYYDALPDEPIEAMCASYLNNKRYFRYKVILCSNGDCVSGGLINPEVTDVIINWAP